jgi:ketosteroid isomerase-like protein
VYGPTAPFTVEPGKIVSGTALIRVALIGSLAVKPSISLKPRVLGNAGDIALVSSEWVLKDPGPDGKPVELTGTSAEVAGRQADGTWKFVVDRPWVSPEGMPGAAAPEPDTRSDRVPDLDPDL